MSHLYVVRIGDTVKVGQSVAPVARFVSYRRDARRYGLTFDVLWISPAHAEVDANERAVLDRFRPQRQRDEYLRGVDPAEVIAFAQELHRTDTPSPTGALGEMVSKHEGAQLMGVSIQTVERYVRERLIRSEKNPITKRVWLASADCRRLALTGATP